MNYSDFNFNSDSKAEKIADEWKKISNKRKLIIRKKEKI